MVTLPDLRAFDILNSSLLMKLTSLETEDVTLGGQGAFVDSRMLKVLRWGHDLGGPNVTLRVLIEIIE